VVAPAREDAVVAITAFRLNAVAYRFRMPGMVQVSPEERAETYARFKSLVADV